MANYKVFAGTVGPGAVGSWDGVIPYYPITCTILVMDENDNIVIPGNVTVEQDPNALFYGVLELASTEPLEYGDDDADFHRKVQGNFAPQYPQITAEDTVTWVWMS